MMTGKEMIMVDTTLTAPNAYGFGLRMEVPFEEAMARTRAALKEQGFGVLTEIDVRQTLKEKLGTPFRRYVILGACNPPLAHRALEADLDIGLLLPCNVVLYEEGNGTTIKIMDPQAALGMVANPAIAPIAAEARARLERVLSALQQPA
jgi:uncharacterized protein (DUF302 family)